MILPQYSILQHFLLPKKHCKIRQQDTYCIHCTQFHASSTGNMHDVLLVLHRRKLWFKIYGFIQLRNLRVGMKLLICWLKTRSTWTFNIYPDLPSKLSRRFAHLHYRSICSLILGYINMYSWPRMNSSLFLSNLFLLGWSLLFWFPVLYCRFDSILRQHTAVKLDRW